MDICQRIMSAQKSLPLGIKAHNLLLNDGPDANQHVPHLHFHIIPRYGKDSWQLVLGLATRMKNFFGQAARRRRLDDLAQAIAKQMAQQ